MAPKPSPNSLIHCAVCGEDYSATYRRCPFCGAKNVPGETPAPSPAPGRGGEDLDDGYVFDGQDLFEDDYEDEEDRRPVRPKGGKRLQEKPSSNPFANADINWPRMITFLCSLVIIIAALIIVFTVIYPQLRGTDKPVDPSADPSVTATGPVAPPSQPADPSDTGPVAQVTDPPVVPTAGPSTADPTLTGLKLNRQDFTLRPGESFRLQATFTPADWNGAVSWSSDDERYATVAADGTVTHVSQDTSLHRVVITATAGGQQAECVVFIAGPLAASDPPASEPPAPAQSDPPVVATQAPSSGGSVTVGRQGTIVGADGGLRVRSGPGTSYDVLATLLNGNTITVVSDAGGGWYQISFSGNGGVATTGYIMGDYISTN